MEAEGVGRNGKALEAHQRRRRPRGGGVGGGGGGVMVSECIPGHRGHFNYVDILYSMLTFSTYEKISKCFLPQNLS